MEDVFRFADDLGPLKLVHIHQSSIGIVSAAAWDFAGGLPSHRMFYDTVAALDPEAGFRQGFLRAVKPARHMISTMTP
jgi:hypothetical protein